MDPLQIVLIIVCVAAVWALIEIALLARKGRASVQTLDSAVNEINETLAEAKPVIAKLDDTLEELQPAVQRVEPLLASANVAVDALSANLVEVEAVVRDVSSFTGTAVNAKHAARGVANSATGAVQRLLSKRKGEESDTDRALTEGAAEPVVQPEEEKPVERQYFTYGADETTAPAGEAAHE